MNVLTPKTDSIYLRSYQSEVSAHAHEHCQWVFPLTGELELEIGCHANSVTADRSAFIRTQQRHCFASQQDNLFLVLDVFPKSTWMDNIAIPDFWELPTAIKQFLQFAKYYLNQHPTDSFVTEIVKDFLLKLLTQHFLTSYDVKVLTAMKWIEINFRAPIKIKSVAQQCHLSDSQLQRRFKHITGQNIAEYWRMARLREAQRLLREYKTSIETIAHSVGYENIASFSRSFMRTFAVTPSDWRRLHFSIS